MTRRKNHGNEVQRHRCKVEKWKDKARSRGKCCDLATSWSFECVFVGYLPVAEKINKDTTGNCYPLAIETINKELLLLYYYPLLLLQLLYVMES